MARWRRWAVIAVALAAAGCGRKDDKGGASPATARGNAQGDRAEVEAFWASWKSALAAGDGRALWNLTSTSNRRAIVERTRASMSSLPDSEWRLLSTLTGQPESKLRAMTPEMLAEETTAGMLGKLREQPAELEKAKKSELASVTVDGDRATLRLKLADGREVPMAAVREADGWKADIASSGHGGDRK